MRVRQIMLPLMLLFGGLLLTQGVSARGLISLDEAVKQAKRQSGGRVISAETREYDGRPVHNIRILTNEGKLRRYQMDGRSGRFIKRKPRP
ncbi:PepSY domain-containing protein [Candidatus Endoriftia persephonae]|nr:PepSY domain-containing protein [Candidatus Endoriftia persephone]EGV51453.1 hypothetical protein Rifp1Sym_bj00280 [endosymbiont of Riftia pachyptila (vent Ph05)]KRT54729.1 Peptidase propeptide and YPEB domain [endosymbiont of Ridgeia piscesae]KRT57539.1 hypothetical protein Ga0076813_11712 [endosymbiont of Ridgeia piscesae]USF86501.1 PepSY domain-containing protein [Candidatus Endoriftia persephone]